eukprot:scaffold8329_cov277-Pinguiococcus_pyrenoidosus.AAC.5
MPEATKSHERVRLRSSFPSSFPLCPHWAKLFSIPDNLAVKVMEELFTAHVRQRRQRQALHGALLADEVLAKRSDGLFHRIFVLSSSNPFRTPPGRPQDAAHPPCSAAARRRRSRRASPCRCPSS